MHTRGGVGTYLDGVVWSVIKVVLSFRQSATVAKSALLNRSKVS